MISLISIYDTFGIYYIFDILVESCISNFDLEQRLYSFVIVDED